MTKDSRIEIIWGARILDEGFTSIPNLLIRNLRKIGMTDAEWVLVCTLLTYKYDARDPYPSEERIAEHMGISERAVRKLIKSLKEKGLILVGHRRDKASKKRITNVYNFKPMIDACLRVVDDFPLGASEETEIEWSGNPEVLEVPMGEQEEPPVSYPAELPVLVPEELAVQKTSRKVPVNKTKEEDEKKKTNRIRFHLPEATDNDIQIWCRLASEETIIQAINRAKEQRNVRNIVAYVTTLLRNGFTPRPIHRDLPEYVIRQEEQSSDYVHQELTEEMRLEAERLLRLLGEIDEGGMIQ